ncbi:MAG: TIGR01440 family protein [Bacilli bacterium]
MMNDVTAVREALRTILADYAHQVGDLRGRLFVVGCSTSEVIGSRIGTNSSEAIAEAIFTEVMQFRAETGVNIAFQCCEHLNRALVLQRSVAEQRGYETVTVVPVRAAGGALSAYAFRHLAEAVVVEHVRADGAIDIGSTLVGMHLRHVAVPVRASLKWVGEAYVTLATARPKLIGGARAVYEQ